MDWYVPARLLSANARRRLMIAQHEQDEVQIVAFPKVTAEIVECVSNRSRIVFAQIRPIRLHREAVDNRLAFERFVRQQA